MITYDDFAKLDIRVAKIISVEKVENADKLLKLQVNIGDESRQIVSGIAEFYTPEALVGKTIIVLVNLEPRTFRGEESQGMLLAVDTKEKPVLLIPSEEVEAGMKIT